MPTGGSEIWKDAEEMSAAPSEVDPLDRAAKDIMRELQLKAAVCEQNFQRAVVSAHQASMQLRAVENRIEELETECAVVRERAERGERWLQHLAGTIERAFLPGDQSHLVLERQEAEKGGGAKEGADLAGHAI
jgi:hypothetical protein